LTLARLVLNTSLRMVYPFAPALARGLQIPLTQVYQLITLRNVSGFISPLFSPLSERYGRRPIMSASLLLFAAGSLVLVLYPTAWVLGITLVVASLAKVIYDPAMQAYIGDKVPYHQRGRAIAITELAWAGAVLIGAPLVGWLITRSGWQSPFLWLGLLAIVGAIAISSRLPKARRDHAERIQLNQIWRVWRENPIVWAACGYVLLVMAANETLFIVYGDWMEDGFNLSLTTLGVTTAVIGGAEVLGELIAGWSSDRFGKRNVIIATGLANAAAYLLIPFIGRSLASALIMLFFLFLFFEMTVVAGVPLLTELVPSARSLVMSLNLAASGLGRAIGSLIGPLIWASLGLVGNGVMAAVIMLTAVFILLRWVHERPASFTQP
jgi:predicted MFS family arabinose efflux permease